MIALIPEQMLIRNHGFSMIFMENQTRKTVAALTASSFSHHL